MPLTRMNNKKYKTTYKSTCLSKPIGKALKLPMGFDIFDAIITQQNIYIFLYIKSVHITFFN